MIVSKTILHQVKSHRRWTVFREIKELKPSTYQKETWNVNYSNASNNKWTPSSLSCGGDYKSWKNVGKKYSNQKYFD